MRSSLGCMLATAPILWSLACGGGSDGGGERDAAVDAPVEDCSPNPCKNGGTCTEVAGGFTCECVSGYGGDRCEAAAWTLSATNTGDLDLLFVVDNSAGMAAEQQKLVDSLADLTTTLTSIGGDLPSIHIGVVSTNVGAAGAAGVPACPAQGDDGNLQAKDFGTAGSPACPSLGGATFLSDLALAAGGRDRNYTGSLADTFACMASLGTGGCGFEMPLESAWRALQAGKNPGFLRPDAHLAVVIVTDEDDCSTEDGAMFGDPTADLSSVLGPRTSFRCHEFGVVCDNDPTPRTFGEKMGCEPRAASPYEFPVSKYVDFFKAAKSDPFRVSLAGLVGPFDLSHVTVGQDPALGAPVNQPAVLRTCNADPNDVTTGAAPAVRLSAFLGAFAGRNAQASVCDDSFSTTMVSIGKTIARQMYGIQCIGDTLADGDAMPGLQPRCTVLLVTDPDGPNRTETAIPQCSAGTPAPCWTIAPDEVACSAGEQAFRIVPAAAPVAPGTVIEARCDTI